MRWRPRPRSGRLPGGRRARERSSLRVNFMVILLRDMEEKASLAPGCPVRISGGKDVSVTARLPACVTCVRCRTRETESVTVGRPGVGGCSPPRPGRVEAQRPSGRCRRHGTLITVSPASCTAVSVRCRRRRCRCRRRRRRGQARRPRLAEEESLPVPPMSESLPAPPRSVSLPMPPRSSSLPAPPWIVSSCVLP